jgi:metal-responsive CopG/Arc/MetJ family transcriptional regulator
MRAPTKVRISVTLSSIVLREIDRLAVRAKISRSAFVEDVVRQHLRHQTKVQSPSPGADWMGSMKDTMKILDDMVSPADEEANGKAPRK